MDCSVYKQLDNIINNNTLFHSYIFELNNYDSDFNIVLTFVKMILSNKCSDYVLNNDLDLYKQIDDNNYIDLRIVEPDGREIKKNQMIKLQEEFFNKSLVDNKRIYIIKECDKFNSSSANTMLKFLEEPCDNVIAILLTNNRYKVIDTILSRCQLISIKNEECIFTNNDLLDLFLNPNNIIMNYSFVFDNYFSEKENTKINLNNLKIGLLNNYELNKDSKLLDYIIVIENNINKLEYNVNYKLWFDCFIAEIMEVYYGYSSD